jgi:hypothetical protein
MLDIEPNTIAVGVEINGQPLDNLAHLCAGCAFELDIETVSFRVIIAGSWLFHTNGGLIYAQEPEIAKGSNWLRRQPSGIHDP